MQGDIKKHDITESTRLDYSAAPFRANRQRGDDGLGVTSSEKIREDLMTDHRKDFEECETATIFKQFEAYGNILGLVSLGDYIWASQTITASILLCGNIYELVSMGKYLWAGLMVTASILLVVTIIYGLVECSWTSLHLTTNILLGVTITYRLREGCA